jgi:hypothetical protein
MMFGRQNRRGRARRSARAAVEVVGFRISNAVLAFFAFLLLFASCSTKSPPPQMVQPAYVPLSKRKITVTAFTNDSPSTATVNAPAPIPAAPPPPQTQAQAQAAPIETPAPANPPPRARILPLSARIASVNEKLRFVIVDFSNSRQPVIDERLGVYRVGEKVAEIKVSGPYRNTTVAADIVAGEVKYGDEVKMN